MGLSRNRQCVQNCYFFIKFNFVLILNNLFPFKKQECCSSETVSFNNLKPDEIYKLGYYYSQYLIEKNDQKNVSFHQVLKSLEIYARYGHVKQDL